MDVHLIRRARDGDRDAAAALAERLACIPAFVRCCNRRLERPLPSDRLSDVAQEAFAAVWGKLERYDGVRDLEGWVFGFCLREVLAAARHEVARAGAQADFEALEDDSPAAERVLELEGVEAAVLELEPPASTIVALKHFEDESFSAIAGRLGMPLGSVKSHYYRAAATLRVRLRRLWRTLQ